MLLEEKMEKLLVLGPTERTLVTRIRNDKCMNVIVSL